MTARAKLRTIKPAAGRSTVDMGEIRSAVRQFRSEHAKPLVCCRVYPEKRSSLYVLAFLWATRDDMIAYAKLMHRDASGCWAYCTPIERRLILPGRPVRRRPIIAEVHFYRGRDTFKIVAHEMFHASLAWARRVRLDFVALGVDDDAAECERDTEERLALVHGDLVDGFVGKMLAAGLYERASR